MFLVFVIFSSVIVAKLSIEPRVSERASNGLVERLRLIGGGLIPLLFPFFLALLVALFVCSLPWYNLAPP